jgi:vacuolar protein sorting-associated protein 72
VYKEPKKNTAIKRIKTPVATTDIPSGTLKKQVVPFTYEAPKVRQSTALKSSQSNELRQKYTEEARTAAKARKSLQQQHQQQQQQQLRFTQAELLAEAVRTEMENTRSLNRLEQLEEEKKTENLTPKAPFTGEIVRYHSCLGRPKTITFLNTDHFPAIFNQTKPKKPHHHHHHKHKPPHHDHHHHQPQQ